MKREAFKMYLKPGYEAEYEKRHAAISVSYTHLTLPTKLEV